MKTQTPKMIRLETEVEGAIPIGEPILIIAHYSRGKGVADQIFEAELERRRPSFKANAFFVGEGIASLEPDSSDGLGWDRPVWDCIRYLPYGLRDFSSNVVYPVQYYKIREEK
jgi:hypothetical protein